MKVLEFPVPTEELSTVTGLERFYPTLDLEPTVGVNASLVSGASITGSSRTKSPRDFHPEIFKSYKKLFKTEEVPVGQEWTDSKSQTHKNGPQCCVDKINVTEGVISAELAQTGYFVIKAWAEGLHQNLLEGKFPLDCSQAQYEEIAYQFKLKNHPHIAGAGVYALTEYNGQICVVAQIKGPGTGHRQLHTSWVGRGINPKFLTEADPIRAAQLANIQAETGLDPILIEKFLTGVRMTVNEPSTGNFNFVSFLVGQSPEFFLETFREETSNQIASDVTLEKLKQAGIGMVPLQGISLVPLEDLSRFASPRVYGIIPELDVSTGKIIIPNKPIELAVANRPHTDGFLIQAAQEGFLKQLIDIGMGAR